MIQLSQLLARVAGVSRETVDVTTPVEKHQGPTITAAERSRRRTKRKMAKTTKRAQRKGNR